MSWLSFTYSAGRPNIVFNIDYSKKELVMLLCAILLQ